MTRLAWLARTWIACLLLLGAGGMAWAMQSLLSPTLLAQSPQQQQPQQRRFAPLQRFRERNSNPNEPRNNSDKPDPEMADRPGSAQERLKGPGNTLSIVEKPETPEPKQQSAAKPAAKPVQSKPADDREAIFEGWENPKVVLLLSGNQMGYIEPCGCTGLENQKGGLTRRMTLLKDLRESRGWTVVPLDVGQISSELRSDRQQEVKLQMIASGFEKMGYAAVGLGPSDLGLSTSELAGIVANLPFVSANVSVYERETGLVPAYRVVNAGGMKIGVTQIVSDSAQRKILASDIQKEPVDAALAKVSAQLKAEKCDFNVLLAYATPEECEAIAKKHPGFNLVVHGELHGEPEREIRQIRNTNTFLAGVGYKGMHVTAVGIFEDPKAPNKRLLKYQRVPLDARFSDSKDGLQLLADYQRALETIGLKGLEITPKPYPGNREFVGSSACGDCHSRAYEKWLETPHAHATESIVNPKERGVPRHHDPECLSCHVTGWNPQGYYPYRTGYLDLKTSEHLLGNGCENCHGPGKAHVDAESGGSASEAELKRLRETMRLPLASAKKKCLECHDLDNSPEFQNEGAFEKYWEAVKHPWRD